MGVEISSEGLHNNAGRMLPAGDFARELVRGTYWVATTPWGVHVIDPREHRVTDEEEAQRIVAEYEARLQLSPGTVQLYSIPIW